MSIENRLIGSAASLSMSLAAAIQPQPRIRVDESGPAAIERLTRALDRQITARLAAEAERDALILELNRARAQLSRRRLHR